MKAPLPHPLRVTALVLLTSALVACQGPAQDPTPALADARAAIATGLPAAYFEDLVTESVLVEGHQLVLVVRSPAGDAAATRAHPQFALLRQTEQDAMHQACALPGVAALAGTDAVLVRRFIDPRDAVFFEVSLPARDCPPPA